MAGYFNKLTGYMYEGTSVAGEELTNGIFVSAKDGKVKALEAANETLKLRVVAKTDFAGLPAVEVLVVDEGADEIYMVENFFNENPDAAYDNAKSVIREGEYVRMRRPATGDHMIITVEDGVFSQLSVDDGVSVDAKGVLKKVNP